MLDLTNGLLIFFGFFFILKALIAIKDTQILSTLIKELDKSLALRLYFALIPFIIGASLLPFHYYLDSLEERIVTIILGFCLLSGFLRIVFLDRYHLIANNLINNPQRLLLLSWISLGLGLFCLYLGVL